MITVDEIINIYEETKEEIKSYNKSHVEGFHIREFTNFICENKQEELLILKGFALKYIIKKEKE